MGIQGVVVFAAGEGADLSEYFWRWVYVIPSFFSKGFFFQKLGRRRKRVFGEGG